MTATVPESHTEFGAHGCDDSANIQWLTRKWLKSETTPDLQIFFLTKTWFEAGRESHGSVSVLWRCNGACRKDVAASLLQSHIQSRCFKILVRWIQNYSLQSTPQSWQEVRPYRTPWEAPLALQGEWAGLSPDSHLLCQWYPASGLGNWLAAVCKCMCLAGSLQFILLCERRGPNREAGPCHLRLPGFPSSNMMGNFSDNIKHEHSRLSPFFC